MRRFELPSILIEGCCVTAVTPPSANRDGVPNEGPTPPRTATYLSADDSGSDDGTATQPSKAHAICGLWLALALELQSHTRADRG